MRSLEVGEGVGLGSTTAPRATGVQGSQGRIVGLRTSYSDGTVRLEKSFVGNGQAMVLRSVP